ncbi:CinA family protein [Aliikangiella marina]|uniref:CinA family protein n=1 Tax=Aliikangiella marina TaxID=1712262 RepID=A0A545TIY0_9GAMM|nr:CinA family protein [Aliikangiella marina]TQV77157.1 CinA family protein [Aliikangiella marina]
MQKIVSQLSVRLIFKQLKVATVESCTGGFIGKALTDQAGSSQWFAGGLITYTNESKTQLADVAPDLIEKYGAVSLEVADAMARGAQRHFPGCVSVAVTGVAGPDGGTPDKPVGTVCIATCLNGRVNAKKFLFEGNREQVRESTVDQALEMVLADIEKK